MREHIDYKGFRIEARPRQLRPGCWSVSIIISKDVSGERRVTPYIDHGTCTTKPEATLKCFEFGKQIVDGVSPE